MLRGVLCVLLSSLFFGITPLGNKYVLLTGMTADCTLFYQTLTMMGGAALVLLVTRTAVKIPRREVCMLLFMGAVGMGGTDYLLNLSYCHLQVSTVLMLHFLYPAMVLLASALLFRQKISKTTGCAVVLSVAGLVLVTDLSGGMDPLGTVLALVSACTYAFFVLSNDYGSVNRNTLLVKLFYLSIGATAVYGVKTFLSGSFSLPADGKTALVLFGVVGIGSLLAFYFITAGVKLVGAGKAAFLNMLEPITGILGGVLLYQESIGFRGWAGCFCVLLSVLLIGLDGAKDGGETDPAPGE